MTLIIEINTDKNRSLFRDMFYEEHTLFRFDLIQGRIKSYKS